MKPTHSSFQLQLFAQINYPSNVNSQITLLKLQQKSLQTKSKYKRNPYGKEENKKNLDDEIRELN